MVFLQEPYILNHRRQESPETISQTKGETSVVYDVRHMLIAMHFHHKT